MRQNTSSNILSRYMLYLQRAWQNVTNNFLAQYERTYYKPASRKYATTGKVNDLRLSYDDYKSV